MYYFLHVRQPGKIQSQNGKSSCLNSSTCGWIVNSVDELYKLWVSPPVDKCISYQRQQI